MLGRAVQSSLRPDDVVRLSTSRSGEAFIGSEESIVSARAALAEDLPRQAGDCDAILLACFGDLGVDHVRQELKKPIISLSDAFFAIASFLGVQVGILTTSEFWAHRLAVEARKKGASSWIAETVSLDISANETALSLRARCQSTVAEMARRGRCQALVLAGAPLVSLSSDVAPASPLPLIDALAIGVKLCRAAHVTVPQRLA